ncbi:MAG TPA: hypothetical protein PLP19_22150 [bacterium]|nr:hypothetical protein [bacterium]HPN46203.1 hypothetical protein [bacterium]
MKRDNNIVVNNSPNNLSSNLAGEDLSSLPQQVMTSLHKGSGGAQGIVGTEGDTWTDLVDEVIYPRLKFKERYMETPEAPFQ